MIKPENELDRLVLEGIGRIVKWYKRNEKRIRYVLWGIFLIIVFSNFISFNRVVIRGYIPGNRYIDIPVNKGFYTDYRHVSLICHSRENKVEVTIDEFEDIPVPLGRWVERNGVSVKIDHCIQTDGYGEIRVFQIQFKLPELFDSIFSLILSKNNIFT